MSKKSPKASEEALPSTQLTDVTAAVTALASRKTNGKEDVFQAAYDPLMYPADKPGLLDTYSS
jgi:hypothetical protein